MSPKCPYENTVNLTNHQRYENGSYLYEGLIIPPENNLIWDKESVPLHLRGCVCEERPCLKLCCQKDEYFDYNWNTSKCMKITSDMKVAWELPLLQQSGKSEMTNIFKHFTTQVVKLCEKLEYLDPMVVEWILMEDGSLIAYDINIESYCFSPVLDRISGEYLLLPYKCIPILDDIGLMWKYTLFEYSQYVLLIFLIITVLVHLVLHELRRNQGEKIFVCYLFSATICHVIVSILNFHSYFQYNSCMSLGFIGYFFYIASYSWLSILCYDIWKHFNESYVELNSSKTLKEFIIYTRFAWLSAGLATFGFVFVKLSPSVDNMFKPGFRIGQCWINSKLWKLNLK
ncbi:G-protein coupled receptor Mth2-like [Calliphora vicina]|uniref:G-protein coupled receptor Mth2-like n=1 Tax=Calliphora vicina TaxID=7373 RepID=UPI00325AE23C